jgi:hypothetical protein
MGFLSDKTSGFLKILAMVVILMPLWSSPAFGVNTLKCKYSMEWSEKGLADGSGTHKEHTDASGQSEKLFFCSTLSFYTTPPSIAEMQVIWQQLEKYTIYDHSFYTFLLSKNDPDPPKNHHA